MTDYLVKLATPTQCATQTISWSGGAGAKVSSLAHFFGYVLDRQGRADELFLQALSIFVQGQGWFAEQLSNNLTDTLGSINWTCGLS